MNNIFKMIIYFIFFYIGVTHKEPVIFGNGLILTLDVIIILLGGLFDLLFFTLLVGWLGLINGFIIFVLLILNIEVIKMIWKGLYNEKRKK